MAVSLAAMAARSGSSSAVNSVGLSTLATSRKLSKLSDFLASLHLAAIELTCTAMLCVYV